MQNTICGTLHCKVPQIGFCIFILQSTIWCTLHCKVCQIVFCIYSTLKLKFIILFASQPMLQYFPYCPWLQDCVPTLAFSSTSFILWIDLCTEYKSTNIFGRRFSYSFHVLAETRPIVPHHFTFYSNPGQTIISWPNRGIYNRTERKGRKCRNQSPYFYRPCSGSSRCTLQPKHGMARSELRCIFLSLV